MLFDTLVEHHVYHGVQRPVTARAYDYLLAGNGLFKRAHSRHIHACMPLAVTRVAGLPDLEPEFSLWPGRVPGRLLYPILADARRHNGREWMYQICLSPEGTRWRVTMPAQHSSAARVDYQAGADGVICDLHSHHAMAAFFSGTDDRDETGFRFYAVIGRVLDRPEISVRLGMYGDFWSLPAPALFADCGPFVDMGCPSRE
jgi:PRTRC genetic system protein A